MAQNLVVSRGKIVITLESGKQTTYDINTGVIVGVSGKQIKQFNAEAKSIIGCYYIENLVCHIYRDWGARKDYLLLADKVANAFPSYTFTKQKIIFDYCRCNNGVQFDANFMKVFKNIKDDFEKEDYPSINALIRKYEDEILRKQYNCSARVFDSIVRWYSGEVRNKLLANSKGLDYVLEHEYYEDYYEMNHGATWGTNDGMMRELLSISYKYIQDCEILNEKPIWKNFLKMVSVAHREATLLRDKEANEATLQYQQSVPLEYENDDLVVLVPSTRAEFKAEADYQQNCVFAYYYPKVKEKQTHVVFIRKKSDINTPYITCEVSNTGRIVQYLTRFNHSVSDEVGKAFYNEYRNHIAENWNYC